MEIREGTQRIENGTRQAIIEFVFTDYIIYVFQGTLSQFDIVIKYKKDGKRIRTPKHMTKSPPWGRNISKDISDLSNYFVTSSGDDLITVILNVFEKAEKEKVDVEILSL